MFNKNKFKACIIAAGKTVNDVATALDLNESTLYRKISNNGAFTRNEIQKLIKELNIENPMDIFFADELA